jgi:hypothetical protein
MLAQRIKTGFHRIGIIGALACGIAAAVCAAYVPFRLTSPEDLNNAGLAGGLALTWLLGGAAFYIVLRAVGWIAAGLRRITIRFQTKTLPSCQDAF